MASDVAAPPPQSQTLFGDGGGGGWKFNDLVLIFRAEVVFTVVQLLKSLIKNGFCSC